MKNIIEKMQRLHQEMIEKMQRLHQEMRELHDEIDEQVIKVAKRYIRAYHDTNRGYGYPSDNSYYSWQIDNDGNIEVTWEEHWSYGGHDAGAFTVPSQFIYDEAALIAFEQSRDQAKQQKKEEELNKIKQEELAQLERLQKKYAC
jgi:hypothetical protein